MGMLSPTQTACPPQHWVKAPNSHFSSKRGPTSVSSTSRWLVFLYTWCLGQEKAGGSHESTTDSTGT